MASLQIRNDDIPDLTGKRVIITGGSSGIGLAAATLFAEKGAKVINLDINPPPNNENDVQIEFRQCDVADWVSLRAAFQQAGDIDIAVANAGVSEEMDYFADTFDKDTGELIEPSYRVLDVNLRAVLNFTKLALSHFRRRKCPGSIVITSSATAYAPEQSLPIYSAGKLAVSSLSATYWLGGEFQC
jgi:NAD(P)-dependent dehydrogenase (short-subunit alcohol dehydrogenase family)